MFRRGQRICRSPKPVKSMPQNYPKRPLAPDQQSSSKMLLENPMPHVQPFLIPHGRGPKKTLDLKTPEQLPAAMRRK